MNNNIKIKLSKALTNNYILLVLVSYIYLIIKINNNSFKELLTYIIVVLLFYIYFKNLKNSYIFGFFVLLIRYVFKQFFNNIENFKENNENIDAINKQTDTAEENYQDNTPEIDHGLTKKQQTRMQEDDTIADSFEEDTTNNINGSAKTAKLGPTI